MPSADRYDLKELTIWRTTLRIQSLGSFENLADAIALGDLLMPHERHRKDGPSDGHAVPDERVHL
jgi:hypothetical protein